MLYLDASALVKLVVPEAESAALGDLVATDARRASSVVVAIEVTRAIRRVTEDEKAYRRAERLLATVDLRAVDDEVIEIASELGPEAIRSLDAIHLASALTVRDDLVAFVAYDRRLQSAAREVGLPVQAPSS